MIRDPSRHPHQVMIVGMVILSGVLGLVPGFAAASVREALGDYTNVYYISCLAFGAMTLAGMFWKNRLDGLIAERAGLVTLTFLVLAYSVAVIARNGASGVLAASFPLGFALASIIRAVSISNELNHVKLGIHDSSDVGNELYSEDHDETTR